jgi:hypothetical protein
VKHVFEYPIKTVYFTGRLESYKQLRGGLEILEYLPIGKTGKVLRSELEKRKSFNESVNGSL